MINIFINIKNKILSYFLNTFIWNNKKYNIDLSILFKELKNYEYALIKVDTPYTPNNFPSRYPIGKDMDIFCTKKDFRKINIILLAFANQYKNVFSIRIIEDNSKYRVRLEKYGQLYYQLDNNYLTDNNLSSVFIENAIVNRIEENGYYRVNAQYELVFRLSELYNSPNKFHHLEYIKKHKNELNLGLIENEKLKKLFYKILEKE